MNKNQTNAPLLLDGREKRPIEFVANVGNAPRRRKDQIRDAARRRYSHHRSKIRQSFDEALRDAALRSNISFHRAQILVSCLVEEMVDRLMQGQYMLIPRLAFFGIVPNAGPKRFRMHAKPDTAVYARIAQELNIPCRDNEPEFWRICQRIETCVFEQIKRGASYQQLLLLDRLMAQRAAAKAGEYIDMKLVQQKRSA